VTDRNAWNINRRLYSSVWIVKEELGVSGEAEGMDCIWGLQLTTASQGVMYKLFGGVSKELGAQPQPIDNSNTVSV